MTIKQKTYWDKKYLHSTTPGKLLWQESLLPRKTNKWVQGTDSSASWLPRIRGSNWLMRLFLPVHLLVEVPTPPEHQACRPHIWVTTWASKPTRHYWLLFTRLAEQYGWEKNANQFSYIGYSTMTSTLNHHISWFLDEIYWYYVYIERIN